MSCLAFRPSRLLLVGLLAVLASAPGPVAALEPPVDPPALIPDSIEGIDVSHHQEVISWGRVGDNGKQFVFIKATEAERYIDPLYAFNHWSARSAGLRTGAYHFAQPSTNVGSAIRQADHFLAWFNLQDGDLLPVLDLERTNGLDPIALTDWTLTWLNRVRQRTGLSAVVYASPLFWRDSLADTTAIADAGYALWVAHWTTGDPIIPAADWGAQGWSVWQYDDCGSVPGITGCALLDHLVGSIDRFVYRGPGFPLTGDHFAPIVTTTKEGRYPDESVRGQRIRLLPRPVGGR